MAKKTRINWSKSPHFDVLVNAVCDYNNHLRFCQANGAKPLSISKFWSINIKGNGQIRLPLRTLSGYIKKKNGSTSRRLGSQVGPKSEASKLRMQYAEQQQRKRQLEIDNIVNHLLGNQLCFFLPGPPMNAASVPLQRPIIEPQWPTDGGRQQREDEGERISRLNQQYKRMSIDFKSLPQRTLAEKREWQDRMARKLPHFCNNTIGGDKDFLDKELELLRQCGKTCGSAEVSYVAPQRGEMGLAGGARTLKRRAKLKRKIDHFQRIQTRQTLALKSGVGRPALMVSVDYLLKRFDQGLIDSGLQPSNLRHQLREYNYIRSQELKEKVAAGDGTSEDASEDDGLVGVKDFDISAEESALLRGEILNEMVLEGDDVSYDDGDSGLERQTLEQMVSEGDDVSYVDVELGNRQERRWALDQTVFEGDGGACYDDVDSGNSWGRRWILDHNIA